MCLKVCVSVAFYLVCLLTLTDGFFLPVFVRKQHPQTPAVNSAQWTSYQSGGAVPGSSGGGLTLAGSGPGPVTNTYKEYNPYQQPQSAVTPLHQVHVSQPLQTQYTYESGSPPYLGPGMYPQYHSAFQSVQLVPCLCPISKDVIEQQSQQYQQQPQPQQPVPSSPASPSEPGTNEVIIKAGQKVNS
ncbi:UNVERIFIED_CONTAM: hypothetical protein PYX00_001231 [Menopon gallinae]|uniref:Uncharacterized protein n=1 Tax=Menopon gallinae TaxID=328185 RepID=A0AAW2ID49_9NEOP